MLTLATSRMMTHKGNGTGAVLRNLETRNRDTIDIEDFATLQQCLNQGKLVCLNGKTIDVTGQVFPISGSGIIGPGTLRFNSSNFPAVTRVIDSTSSPIYVDGKSQVLLKGFKIEVTSTQNTCMYPIAFSVSSNCRVENVDISGMNGGAMVAVNSSSFIDVVYNKFHSSVLDRTSFGQLTGIEVDNYRVLGLGSSSCKFNNNAIYSLTCTSAFNTTHGYQTDGINIQTTSNKHQICHNTIELVGEGIDLFCDDSLISGNVINKTYLWGIKLVHGASRNKVTLNKIHECGIGGIVVGGSSSSGLDTDRNSVTYNDISRVDYLNVWSAEVTYAIACNNDGTWKATNTFVSENRCFLSPNADYHLVMGGTGAGNKFINNHSDGSPAASTFLTNGFLKWPDRVGDSTGLSYISGTAPLLRVTNENAPSNEKIYERKYIGGDIYDYTINDDGTTGNLFYRLYRDGITATIAQFAADKVRRGGVVASVRYEEADSQGRVVQRFDDNGSPVLRTCENDAITGAGQGMYDRYYMGTGGVQGGIAFEDYLVSTDTWANLAARSAKRVFKAMFQGVLTTIMEMIPGTGIAVTGSVAATGAVSGTTITGTGAVSGASVAATGAVTGATAQFAGVAISTRYTSVDTNGKLTTRVDVAAGVQMRALANYGITSIGHGIEETWTLGVGNVAGVVAGRTGVYATDVWTSSGASSAQYLVRLALNGVETTIMSVDPKAGFVDLFITGLRIQTLGKGISIKEGANGKMGLATLVAGTVVVSNTTVTAASRIQLTVQETGTFTGNIRVSARSVGSSFTILSSVNTDTAQVLWEIKEAL